MIVQYGKHKRLLIDAFAKLVMVPVYFVLIAVMYSGYAASAFGYSVFSLDTLSLMRMAIEILIASVLIIRFMPFREHYISSGDAGIIFASATFLVANVFLERYTAYLKTLTTGVLQGINTGISTLNTGISSGISTLILDY